MDKSRMTEAMLEEYGIKVFNESVWERVKSLFHAG